MASGANTLRIVASRPLGAETRAVDVACVDGPAFASVGGRYVIVHTGVTAGDRPIKRAYSLLPVAGHPDRARLTIKRLGPGSTALHGAPVGTELRFSGPWGQLTPADGLAAQTLVVATDTGITAALGVVLRHSPPAAEGVELLWLRAEQETFLDVGDVAAQVREVGARFAHATIPAVDAPDRVTVAGSLIESHAVRAGATMVVMAGDGAVLHAARTRLLAITSPVRDVRIECFFRNPEKKST